MNQLNQLIRFVSRNHRIPERSGPSFNSCWRWFLRSSPSASQKWSQYTAEMFSPLNQPIAPSSSGCSQLRRSGAQATS